MGIEAPVHWQRLSITSKFISVFSVLLAIIIVVAVTGYLALLTVERQTRAAILTSTRIQQIVLQIDAHLARARNIQNDFFLQPATADNFNEARQTYVDQHNAQIDQIVALSTELQILISQDAVSDMFKDITPSLNVFLSAADRYDDTFAEAVDIAAQLEDPVMGAEVRWTAQSAQVLANVELFNEADWILIYREMQSLEKDYINTRHRPVMQMAFNISTQLSEAIADAPNLPLEQRLAVLTSLDDYVRIADEVFFLDKALTSKLNEFDLHDQSLDPITVQLIALAEDEVRQAQVQIRRTSYFATVFFVTAVAGAVVLVGLVAFILNQSVTRNVLKLSRAAGALQQGQLDAQVHIAAQDELGHLAHIFNSMAVRIKTLVDDLQARITEGQVVNAQLQQEIGDRIRAETELRAYQEQLEVLVEERTADLQAAKSQYQGLFNSVPLGLFRSTPDGQLINANPAAIRMLGYQPEDVHHINAQSLYVYPEDQARFEAQLHREGRVDNFEVPFHHKAGYIIWVSVNVQATYDSHGQALYHDGSVEDVTDRKATLQALHHQQRITESLRQIGEILNRSLDLDAVFTEIIKQLATVISYDGMSIFLPDGNDLVISRASGFSAKYRGARIARSSILTVAEVFRTQQCMLINNVHTHPSWSVWAGGEVIQSWIGAPLLAEGQTLGVLTVDNFTVEAYTAQDGQILQMFANQAATAIYNAHMFEEVQHSREAAERANQAKSTFLANMSHELRTPLNAILGFTQLMQRDPTVTAKQRDDLTTINRSGEHLLNLINDVLEMSKIEAGQATLSPSNFDLYDLLDGLENLFQLRARAKNLHLTVERASEVPRYIRTDESKLRQVLINLLGNAVKFTDAGGIVLRVYEATNGPTPSMLHFDVEDTGIGIAEDEMSHLFDMFVQTQSGKRLQEGTGLGLPISQQYVQLMGGELTVQSVLNQGSVFKFGISFEPVTAADVQTVEVARRVTGLIPGQPAYRLLVVEDRWESQQLLVKLLQQVGFLVEAADNGQEAIKLWESWHPHLIFMDMRMPVMDGYEATQFIKSNIKGQATVIIALTASAFEQDRTAILASGCDDFIRKPFREADIFNKIGQHLGVGYIYKDPTTTDLPTVASPSPEDVAAGLAQLPPHWQADLSQAARTLDSDMVYQLIQQIVTTHPSLADALTTLVDNFQFDTLQNLLTHIPESD